MSTNPGAILSRNVSVDADQSEIAAMSQVFDQLHGATLVATTPTTAEDESPCAFVVIPQGKSLASVEEFYRERRNGPRFHRQHASLTTVDALLAFVERFKQPGTVVYCGINTKGNGSVDAVLDHDTASEPRDRQWIAQYAPMLSDQWKLWMKAGTGFMNQDDFAEFLEDRIVDICEVPADDQLNKLAEQIGYKFAAPMAVLAASRGLKVKLDQEVTNTVVLASGEVQVAFAEKHTKDAGAVDVPRLFAITIPLWEHGATYRMAVRLRYRVTGDKKIAWQCLPYQADRIIEHASTALAKTLSERCEPLGVPVFQGTQQ